MTLADAAVAGMRLAAQQRWMRAKAVRNTRRNGPIDRSGSDTQSPARGSAGSFDEAVIPECAISN